MDPKTKKRIKQLDCIIAILTFACVVVFSIAVVIGILLINSIF